MTRWQVEIQWASPDGTLMLITIVTDNAHVARIIEHVQTATKPADDDDIRRSVRLLSDVDARVGVSFHPYPPAMVAMATLQLLSRVETAVGHGLTFESFERESMRR